ncbi:hypothetical protein KSC_062170 [Ktedonobacter sp. SOSP1-52]|nr:hypothetical protein KSC_062170 [Ktedonobacter sp. SOSP1-52]
MWCVKNWAAPSFLRTTSLYPWTIQERYGTLYDGGFEEAWQSRVAYSYARKVRTPQSGMLANGQWG